MSGSDFQEIWSEACSLVAELWPDIASNLHLIAAALLPIYAGSHASLSRPTTAAKPRRRRKHRDGKTLENSQFKMEGLTPKDALLYPLFTGLMLTSLYHLIKWLDDPKILSKILNWYLSLFGIFALTTFLTDACTVIQSVVLPTAYVRNGKVWYMSLKRRMFRARGVGADVQRYVQSDFSPLPPGLHPLQTILPIRKLVWTLREILSKPLYIIDTYAYEMFEASIAVGPALQLNALLAILATLYFNLVDKPWWLTNIMGFSYAYGALQLISPTTFATGTLVLFSLFFYDIYFVFFTPMMLTVAKELDIPVKLLIPRPPQEDEPVAQALSMLGLGDIVLPGIMIGLALRFDLYLFYLKKQTVRSDSSPETDVSKPAQRSSALNLSPSPLIYDSKGVGRIEYKQATGYWGERFWLGRHLSKLTGPGCFPKTYFFASIIGYITGLVVTLVVLLIFQHGQPALLYLVPGVLFAQWGTAFVKGDLKAMWEYTELEEDLTAKSKTSDDKKAAAKDDSGLTSGHITNEATENMPGLNEQSLQEPATPMDSAQEIWSDSSSASLKAYETLPIARPPRSIFSLSINLPPKNASNGGSKEKAEKQTIPDQ